jgi:TonB family protein
MEQAATFQPRDPMRGAFGVALALHAGIIAALAIHAWWVGRGEQFGDTNPGAGAVSIQAVPSINIPHRGEVNPLANDSQSEVPQQKSKPEDRVKEQVEKPNAVALKQNTKQKKAPEQSQHQKFRPYDELAKNQMTSNLPQQVSSPMFAAAPGAGNVGTSASTTFGSRFGGYASQIQQIVAQHWRTGDVDARLQTAPVVIATFDLMKDGTIRNVAILQRSGNPALDASVQRAILDSNPLPPFPPGLDKSSAKVEFTFELKR